MGKAWIKQEIKKDKFTETVDKTVSMAKSHPERAIGIAAGVVVAALVAVYSVARFYEVRSLAWDELAAAETKLKNGENGVAAIEELRNRFPTAPAAEYAGLLKGDIQYFNGRYGEAAATYSEALERARPATRPFALANLALALEAAGEKTRAAEKLREFLEQYPEHFLAPQAHFALARAQESLDQKGDAKTIYDKIAILYPDTDWARDAQERSKALGGSGGASPAPPPMLTPEKP